MLIHNHSLDGGENHGALIKRLLAESDSADLMVSYVKSTGADFLEPSLAGTKLRVLCARDMGITDPLALVGLADMGAQIKIYECVRGNFHPKMWLFNSGGKPTACVVGSANMSAGAFLHNVEVGALFNADHQDILKQARQTFDLFWLNREALAVERGYLEEWNHQKQKREESINKIRNMQKPGASPQAGHEALKTYISSWIDIGVHEKTLPAKIRGNLWRGWYIVPDQIIIDDKTINHLRRVCRIIASVDYLDFSSESANPQMGEICEIVREKLQGKKNKMETRALFVRQEKNYLVKFGFVEEIGDNKTKTLSATTSGKLFAEAETLAQQKKLYTEAIDSHIYNGLPLLSFLRGVLAMTGHLTDEEFSLFANHAYSPDELDTIISLTLQYRALPKEGKDELREWYSGLFEEKLEPTGKGVRTNYNKKVRYTLSALGWCEGLRYHNKKITTDAS